VNFDIQFDIANSTIKMISDTREFLFGPEMGYWSIKHYALGWGFSTYDILDGDYLSFLMLDMNNPDIVRDRKALRSTHTNHEWIKIDQVIIKSARIACNVRPEYSKVETYIEIQEDPCSELSGAIKVTRQDFEKWHYGKFQDLLV